MKKTATELSEALASLIEKLHPLLPDDFPWSADVKAGEFETALESIEPRLEQAPEDSALKLWWLRCQLEVATLPLAALAAPLHEISDTIHGEQKLHTLGCSTYVRAAVSFFSREQLRLGVQMLRKIVDFLPSLAQNHSELLLQTSLQIVEQEIEHAPLRREAPEYLSELEIFSGVLKQKLESLASQDPQVTTPTAAHEPTRSAVLNSKSILSAAHEETLNKESIEQSSFDKPKGKLIQGDTARGMKIFASLILASILLLALFSWQYIFHGENARAISERLEYVALELEHPKPLAPKPEGFSKQSSSQDALILDSVSSRLEKLGAEPKAKNDEAVRTESDIDREALDPKNAKNLASSEDELVSMSNIPQAENAINKNNIPEMSTGRFSTTKVEDVGTSRRKTGSGIQPSGNPIASGNQNTTTSTKSPRAAEDLGEESFNPPKLYRTITPTEVLSAPSLLAKSLARLESNTPVHVTKRMGRWLQLRSTGGRTGFIYAQDASASSK